MATRVMGLEASSYNAAGQALARDEAVGGQATGPGPLFVTGMQRAGTTLLEKLLSAHPRVSLLSQPFPFLFVESMRRFLSRLEGTETRYPLGNLFLEDRYGAAQLRSHLASERWSRSDLLALFRSHDGFPGQYTRFGEAVLEQALSGCEGLDLAGVVAQLYARLAHRIAPSVAGGKETLCEEFLPHLLERGFRAAVILRDPRDVVASLNHGDGGRYGGTAKPTLFNVRNWRKSVAFALHLQASPGFQWLRYEDLVRRPGEVLASVTAALGLEPVPREVYGGELFDQGGQPWSGNSSHSPRSGISSASVGRYQSALPASVSRFVEATCWPELQVLGYPTTLSKAHAREAITGFEDPYSGREELAHFAGPVERDAELERLEMLDAAEVAAPSRWFLFEDVCARLRARAVARARE